MALARRPVVVLAVALAASCLQASLASSGSGAAQPRRLISCGAVPLGVNCTVTAQDVCILDDTAAAAVCADICDESKAPSDYKIAYDNEEENAAMALLVEEARALHCPETRQDTCPPGELCSETPNGMCVVAGADGRECRDMCDYSYDPEDYKSGTAEGAASTVEAMRYSLIPGFSDCDNKVLSFTLLLLLCCCCVCAGLGVVYLQNVRERGGKSKRGLSQQRFDPVLDVPPAANGTADDVRAPMLEESQFPTNDTRVTAAYEAELERFKEAEAAQAAPSLALETKFPQQTGMPQSPQQLSTVFPAQQQEFVIQQQPTPPQPLPAPPVLTVQQPVQQPMQQPVRQLQMPPQQLQPQPQTLMTPASAVTTGYRQPLSQPLVSQQSMPQQTIPTALTQVVAPQYQQMLPPQYQTVQQTQPMTMNPMATQPPSAFQTPNMASRPASLQVPGGSYYYQQ